MNVHKDKNHIDNYMKKRIILFSFLSEDLPNLFSLISENENVYSFSDSQMALISEAINIKSFDTIRSRMIKTTKSYQEIKDKFVKSVISERENYDFWYRSPYLVEKENCWEKINKYQMELLQGIKKFFDIQNDKEVELQIINVRPDECLQGDRLRLLKVYLDTCNTKINSRYRIDGVILPNIRLLTQSETITRERFLGKREGEWTGLDEAIAMQIVELFKEYEIPIWMQFETIDEAGPKHFALHGNKLHLLSMQKMRNEVDSSNVTICYPNLSSEIDDCYLGAAFIACACLISNRDDAVLNIPRELYPYGESVLEEIERNPIGCILTYNRNHMELKYHNNLKGRSIKEFF